MAMAKCPECDKEVSDAAKCCPHCGYLLRRSLLKPIAAATTGIILVVGLVLVMISTPQEGKQKWKPTIRRRGVDVSKLRIISIDETFAPALTDYGIAAFDGTADQLLAWRSWDLGVGIAGAHTGWQLRTIPGINLFNLGRCLFVPGEKNQVLSHDTLSKKVERLNLDNGSLTEVDTLLDVTDPLILSPFTLGKS